MDIIDREFREKRNKLSNTVGNLLELCVEINHKELIRVLSDLRSRIEDPFMFVVVGEVKAGKSSFINALLNTTEDICKVAPSPMTDTIQLISYGEYREEPISPTFKRIYYPEDILKEVSVVDTPGTNTIIEYHEEITQKFIPSSDLVIFVFEAKNPYRQSSWDLFHYVSEEWHKKIIFILQQKDLMTEDDLSVNIGGLKDHAVKQGIEEPIIFAVSAKLEKEGESDSGYLQLRNYINQNITGGKAPYLKFKNNLDTFLKIYGKVEEGIEIRQKQLDTDLSFREDVNETLEREEEKSKQRVHFFVENLIDSYRLITEDTKEELKAALSFVNIMKMSFGSIFNKKMNLQTKMQELTQKLDLQLNSTLKNKIDQGAEDIGDTLKQMLQIIDLKIQNSQTFLKNDHEIFSNIALKRSESIEELRRSFRNLISTSNELIPKDQFSEKHKFSKNVLQGSGLAVIGVILASITQLAIFDITGGVLTAVGITFAGLSSGRKRKKILNKFSDIMNEGRLNLHSKVNDEIESFIDNLMLKIKSVFQNFDELIATEKEKIKELQEKKESIEKDLDEIKRYVKIIEI